MVLGVSLFDNPILLCGNLLQRTLFWFVYGLSKLNFSTSKSHIIVCNFKHDFLHPSGGLINLAWLQRRILEALCAKLLLKEVMHL